MEDNNEPKYIEKNISPFYYEKPNQIEFRDFLYAKQKTERVSKEELERFHVFDVNRKKKEELAKESKDFVQTITYTVLQEKIKSLIRTKF